jgi:hypothetical protein
MKLQDSELGKAIQRNSETPIDHLSINAFDWLVKCAFYDKLLQIENLQKLKNTSKGRK